MARLFRPHIPVEIKLRVALKGLGEIFIDDVIGQHKGGLGTLLDLTLIQLAMLHGCTVDELDLDHHPPLGARPRKGEGKKTIYTPDANDPDFLFYRPHGTQFAGSHDIKTRIRGDHGQFSDLVLIKRARRNKNRNKIRGKWLKRKLQSAGQWPKGRKFGTRKSK